MSEKRSESSGEQTITINRAPVLTLWAAVVAQRLGFDHEESLTLGRAVAGLNAYSKGVRLGLFQPGPKEARRAQRPPAEKESFQVDLLHRAVPCRRTPEGIRALSKGKAIDPDSVREYLESRFGESLQAATLAMRELAGSLSPDDLAGRAYSLYESFRPSIPAGRRGWGATGVLDLLRIQRLATER